MKIGDVSEQAKIQLAEALKKKALATAKLVKNDDGWNITVEIIEEEHIPSKFDSIGIYDVTLDSKGNLTGWTRTGSRLRG